MKKRLTDLLPLIVMAFFTIEMTLFVLFVIKSPMLLIAYIPLLCSIIILIMAHLKKKEPD